MTYSPIIYLQVCVVGYFPDADHDAVTFAAAATTDPAAEAAAAAQNALLSLFVAAAEHIQLQGLVSAPQFVSLANAAVANE